jgi:hypothetical protein
MPPPTGEYFKKTQLLYFACLCYTCFQLELERVAQMFIVKVNAFLHKA